MDSEKGNKNSTQMESNKGEAIRAKEIAESKFIARDYFGARHFALKAQNLFPDIEGIPQWLTTLDVYVASEYRRYGEVDWYAVLGVDPRDDDDTVKDSYLKLALMLHPDKNKSIGADGAFKLISKAWSLLSDKAKRVAYDEKINGKAFKQHAKEHVSNSANESKPKTFWTFCHRCRMRYEYLIVYLNCKLLCKSCRAVFLAVQIASPVIDIRLATTQLKLLRNQQRFYQLGVRRFSRTSGVSPVAQDVNVVQLQHAYEKVKREREEAQADMKMEGELCRKLQDLGKDFFSDTTKRRRGMEDSSLSSHGHGKIPVNRTGLGNDVVGESNLCNSKQGKRLIYKITKTTSATQNLMENAIDDISKKLSEMETNPTEESGNDYQKANGKEEDMVKVKNEDAIIEESVNDNMTEDNGEEIISVVGKLGEGKEGNNKDIQK